MIVEVSQLGADVGCGDVYMMTATDRAIEPTQTCTWECLYRWTGMTIDFWLSQMEAMRWEVQLFDVACDEHGDMLELCVQRSCVWLGITLCSFFNGLNPECGPQIY